MAISLYDQCTTTDWENIALRVSQVSAALALVISIVALSLGTLIEPSERTFLFLSIRLKSHQLHRPTLLLPPHSHLISYPLLFSPTPPCFFFQTLLSPSSSFYTGYLSWVSFYTLAVGLVLSIWELPIIYYCIPAGGPCFCKELEAKAVVRKQTLLTHFNTLEKRDSPLIITLNNHVLSL